jgi:hypothetical protein
VDVIEVGIPFSDPMMDVLSSREAGSYVFGTQVFASAFTQLWSADTTLVVGALPSELLESDPAWPENMPKSYRAREDWGHHP